MQVFVTGGSSPSSVLDDITATPAQVLKNYTYNDSEGEKQTGTMSNHGAVTCSLGYGGTYTGSAGYYSSINITAPGRYGNATASQVLSGKTFMNSSGNQTGTMANRGSVTCTLGYGASYVNSGYYSSINITAPSRYGNATASQVLSGKTFMNSSGNYTGTMTNRGGYSCSLNIINKGSTRQWANSGAGYYSSVNVGVTHNVSHFSGTLNGYWVNSGIAPNTSWWGGRSADTATSFKIVNCGGYLWYTRNQGDNSTIHIYYVTNVV